MSHQNPGANTPADGPPGGPGPGTSPPPPPPPPPPAAFPASPGSYPGRPPLRRSRSDRKVAGVAGGLGRYLNIDPLVFRIVLAVLAVFGGAGVLLYGIGWLLIPIEGEAESEGERLIRGRADGSAIAAIVAVLVGIGIFGGFIGNGFNTTALALLAIVAIGLVIAVREGGPREWLASPTTPTSAAPGGVPPGQQPAGPTPSPLHNPAGGGVSPAGGGFPPGGFAAGPAAGAYPAGPGYAAGRPVASGYPTGPADPAGPTGPGYAAGRPVASGYPTGPADPAGPGYAAVPAAAPAGAASTGAPTQLGSGSRNPSVAPPPFRTPYPPHYQYGSPDVPYSTPPPPAPPKERSSLVGITISAAVIVAGILISLGLLWGDGIDVELVLAATMLVLGTGLVVGAWFGRGRSLLAWGSILTAVLIVAAAWSIPLEGGIGQRLWAPGTVAEAQSESPYRLAIGNATLDLTDITPGQSYEVESSVGVGQLTVWVPDNVNLDGHVHAGIGNVNLPGEPDTGGIDVDRNIDVRGTTTATIVLDLKVGIGEVKVLRETP